ncbi:hypothetical protein [Williamsia sp. CHRR-6]|uniref:hypothetical protein n=1 Tax=Williamsia sp. CHRR-6 TaxID=2835871 RepID=UPI001BDB65B8|nr:hypothetical protein [Williamsia sp. CHRR-6]MBT0568540.1 hypothetical protein [Williamsia sp. CHRR-6]
MLVLAQTGLLMLTFMASLFEGMVTDACSSETDCDFDKLGLAMKLQLGGGTLVVLSSIVLSVVLVARRRPAAWVPLVGMSIQILLVVIAFHLLGQVVEGDVRGNVALPGMT